MKFTDSGSNCWRYLSSTWSARHFQNMGNNRGQIVASSKDDANAHDYGVIDRQNWQNRGAV